MISNYIFKYSIRNSQCSIFKVKKQGKISKQTNLKDFQLQLTNNQLTN